MQEASEGELWKGAWGSTDSGARTGDKHDVLQPCIQQKKATQAWHLLTSDLATEGWLLPQLNRSCPDNIRWAEHHCKGVIRTLANSKQPGEALFSCKWDFSPLLRNTEVGMQNQGEAPGHSKPPDAGRLWLYWSKTLLPHPETLGQPQYTSKGISQQLPNLGKPLHSPEVVGVGESFHSKYPPRDISWSCRSETPLATREISYIWSGDTLFAALSGSTSRGLGVEVRGSGGITYTKQIEGTPLLQ